MALFNRDGHHDHVGSGADARNTIHTGDGYNDGYYNNGDGTYSRHGMAGQQHGGNHLGDTSYNNDGTFTGHNTINSTHNTSHNPLTGNTAHSAHNPLTGNNTHSTHNPLTGNNAHATHNPLTGNNTHSTHNPLTGNNRNSTHNPLTGNTTQSTHNTLGNTGTHTGHNTLTGRDTYTDGGVYNNNDNNNNVVHNDRGNRLGHGHSTGKRTRRGIFSKRGTRTSTGPVSTYSNTHDTRYDEKPLPQPRKKHGLFDKHSGHFNRRPSFGQWLKGTLIDIVTMIIMGAIGLGVYFADPAPSRSFPVIFQDGQIVYPQFAYPLRNEIIPIWAAALLAALVPIFFFLVMQIRIRSFWDANNAILGLLYSLITAAVFQVFVKWLIGGLRPHFLEVCQPDLERIVNQPGDGYGSIMFTSDICTGDRSQINDALESMPSGHSTAAFAGFMFLYFYLNAKLKIFANHQPAMWKLVVLYMPVLAACLIAGALTIDEYHNWYDCLAGAIIGTVFAISAYRMMYASVWDFRFNHIPLTRHTPFSYGAGAPGAAGFETAVFTRKAGWGYEEAFGGAPFDAAHHLRGQVPSPGQVGTAGTAAATALDGDLTTCGRHRTGDVEHNAAYTDPSLGHGRGTGTGMTTVGDTGLGTTMGTGTGIGTSHTPDNRYRQNRKSLERKAVGGPGTTTTTTSTMTGVPRSTYQ